MSYELLFANSGAEALTLLNVRRDVDVILMDVQMPDMDGFETASHSQPLQIRCFDGTTKTILASASPLHGLNGQTVGAVVLIRDLTESKRIEADLAQRATRLVSLGVELEKSAAR